MKVYQKKDLVIIEDLEDFDLEQTMECGQAFHFVKIGDNEYGIVAFNRLLHAKQTGRVLTLYNTTIQDYENIWKGYFDIERDYSHIKKQLLCNDIRLKEAVETMWGVRILNQDFFETLISFIISQNKQIPHIKQIVSTISRKYGEYLGKINDEEFYSFPTVNKMACISEDELRECKTGFRAPYIKCAVDMVSSGEIKETDLKKLNAKEVVDELIRIKGVGVKVANCVSLFGLGKRESFPVDVWIKRIVETIYFDGEERSKEQIESFGIKHFGEYGGYAQQYLFYYGKTVKLGVKNNKNDKK